MSKNLSATILSALLAERKQLRESIGVDLTDITIIIVFPINVPTFYSFHFYSFLNNFQNNTDKNLSLF